MALREDNAQQTSPGMLVLRASAGDHDAWTALHDHYVRLLWHIARSYGLGSEDAGDVVQTTWLRLVERLGSLRDPGSVGSWLATTARRESLRTMRRLTRERITEAWTSHITGPHHVVFRRDRQRQVAEALEATPPRCRSLLTLMAMSPEFSYAEISAALDIPLGSIGPTRARCLEHLRQRLEGKRG